MPGAPRDASGAWVRKVQTSGCCLAFSCPIPSHVFFGDWITCAHEPPWLPSYTLLSHPFKFLFLPQIMLSQALTVALLVLPSFATPEPLHIPISRRTPHTRSIPDYAKMADNLRQKYGYTLATPPRTRKRASTASVPVTNQVCHPSLSTYFR